MRNSNLRLIGHRDPLTRRFVPQPALYDLLGTRAPSRFGEPLPSFGGNASMVMPPAYHGQGIAVGGAGEVIGGIPERLRQGLTIQHELSPATLEQLRAVQAQQKSLIYRGGAIALGLGALVAIAIVAYRAGSRRE